MLGWLKKRQFEKARAQAVEADVPAYLRVFLDRPLPDTTSDAATAPILALDFETNGLEPGVDHLLSIGSVAMTDGTIDLGSSWHTLVATRKALREDVVPVHRITHDMIEGGVGIDAAFEGLFDRLKGRFLLAHHAPIETGFMSAILFKLYGVRIPFAAIDTLALEQRILSRGGGAESARLIDARKRYGLPIYGSHHALTDALAAAELYQAQCAHHFGDATVADLLSYYP